MVRLSLSDTLRSLLWLGFFAAILVAWWVMYVMAVDMDLDLLGRPGAMGEAMRQMDPRMPMYMPMASFGLVLPPERPWASTCVAAYACFGLRA